MASATDTEIDALNDLIEVTLDSAKGYEDAADQSRSERLKTLFSRFAKERWTVVGELQQIVRTRGGTPEDSDSILAKAHRMFLNLKNTVIKQDDIAVIEEVERGEDHLKDRWERVLNGESLSPAFRNALAPYFTSVKAGHDEVSAMKHAAAHGTR